MPRLRWEEPLVNGVGVERGHEVTSRRRRDLASAIVKALSPSLVGGWPRQGPRRHPGRARSHSRASECWCAIREGEDAPASTVPRNT